MPKALTAPAEAGVEAQWNAPPSRIVALPGRLDILVHPTQLRSKSKHEHKLSFTIAACGDVREGYSRRPSSWCNLRPLNIGLRYWVLKELLRNAWLLCPEPVFIPMLHLSHVTIHPLDQPFVPPAHFGHATLKRPNLKKRA